MSGAIHPTRACWRCSSPLHVATSCSASSGVTHENGSNPSRPQACNQMCSPSLGCPLPDGVISEQLGHAANLLENVASGVCDGSLSALHPCDATMRSWLDTAQGSTVLWSGDGSAVQFSRHRCCTALCVRPLSAMNVTSLSTRG